MHCPQSSRRETFCGTLDYLAPEVVESEQYDFGIDIWGIGVLLFELVAGVRSDTLLDNTSRQATRHHKKEARGTRNNPT